MRLLHYLTRRLLFFFLLLFSGILLLNGCSKDENNTPAWPGNQLLIDKNFSVPYAKDNGADVTANYNGIIFRFAGPATSLTGTATAANSLFTVTGTWTMNSSRDKISFSFPTNLLPDLAFMNKTWKITNAFVSPVVLKADNGEDDEVRLLLN
jgi:hypothetical protein